MAKNQTNHQNRHCLYLAATGYGKSTAMKTNPLLKSAKRLIVWDPGVDHKVNKRVHSLREFYAELLKQASSGPISLALTLDKNDPKSFEVFCAAVWQVLDGNQPTVLVVEEAARVQLSNGKAGQEWGILVAEGRKFGLIILATSQRSQELDKTIFTQVQTKYVGCHDIRDAQLIAPLVGLQDAKAIHGLKQGEFYRKELGPEPAQRVNIKPAGQGFKEQIVKT